jgi:hypothetical protein
VNNQLSPQTTEHKKDHDILQTWHWDRHKNVVGLNQLMGSQSSSPDNLVSKKNAVINRIKYGSWNNINQCNQGPVTTKLVSLIPAQDCQ